MKEINLTTRGIVCFVYTRLASYHFDNVSNVGTMMKSFTLFCFTRCCEKRLGNKGALLAVGRRGQQS